ncbi:MAG: hypothetical protein ACI8UZ_001353, partial [Akkermansiaceae bacterium]
NYETYEMNEMVGGATAKYTENAKLGWGWGKGI